MNIFIIVQILGLITLAVFVISLQQSKKENFLLFQVIGTFLFIVQYILTDRYTGAILFSIVLIRGMVYYFYKKKGLAPSLKIMLMFQAALGVAAVLSWQDVFSAFALVATATKTWGTWQDNMPRLRASSMLAQVCMVVYNLSAAMFTGAVTEGFTLVSTAVAIRRYDVRKKGADSPQ